MIWERVAFPRPLAHEPGDSDGLGSRLFGRQLVRCCSRLGLREFQLQLLDQPGASFRALAVDLPLELGDPQLLVGNQGQVFGCAGPRIRQFGGTNVAFSDHFAHPGALLHERSLQCGDVVRQGCEIGVHDRK